MKRTLRVDFGETLSVGGYQSVKPALSDSFEYNTDDFKTITEEEEFRKAFKEKVRQEYFALKQQMVRDFIEFGKQIQGVYVPCKQ